MKPKPLIVQAFVQDGTLKVPSRKIFLAALKRWPEMPVELEIRPFEESRRARANRYLWAVVYKMIAEEMGQSPDDVHEIMKLRHNAKWVKGPDSEDKMRVGATTTKLTIGQFSDYIDRVMLDGAEFLGIVFPPPRGSEVYKGSEAIDG